MTLHEAQQHVHRMVRERRAVEFMAGVIDAAVWSEDATKNADLAIRNARKQVQAIESQKDKLEAQTLAILASHEDMQRQGQALSEKLAVYEKSIEVCMAALDGEYEKEAERLDAQVALLEASKETLLGEVSVLRAEKASIEGVIEAFRKANTETVR